MRQYFEARFEGDVTLRPPARGRYRIMTNGDEFKVQYKRRWWHRWMWITRANQLVKSDYNAVAFADVLEAMRFIAQARFALAEWQRKATWRPIIPLPEEKPHEQ